MKTLPTQLFVILHYLNWESGKKTVRERLENTYDWLGCKLSRTTEPDQLKKLKAKPGDPEAQEKWRLIIEEAIEEDDLFYNEFNVRMVEAGELIRDKDPEWYQAHLSNQLNSTLSTN
jgi:hypothetical protein